MFPLQTRFSFLLYVLNSDFYWIFILFLSFLLIFRNLMFLFIILIITINTESRLLSERDKNLDLISLRHSFFSWCTLLIWVSSVLMFSSASLSSDKPVSRLVRFVFSSLIWLQSQVSRSLRVSNWSPWVFFVLSEIFQIKKKRISKSWKPLYCGYRDQWLISIFCLSSD